MQVESIVDHGVFEEIGLCWRMSLCPEDLPCETEAPKALALALSAENAELKGAMKQINLEAFSLLSERRHLMIEEQMGLDLGHQTGVIAVLTAAIVPFLPARRNIGQLSAWLPRVVEVIEPGTNFVDQTIRSCALGRRNYLYACNDDGPEIWAILVPLLMTARRNNIDLFTWLSDVPERIVSG